MEKNEKWTTRPALTLLLLLVVVVADSAAGAFKTNCKLKCYSWRKCMGQLSGNDNRPGELGNTGQIVLTVCEDGGCDCEELERLKTSTTTTTTSTTPAPFRRGSLGRFRPKAPSPSSSSSSTKKKLSDLKTRLTRPRTFSSLVGRRRQQQQQQQQQQQPVIRVTSSVSTSTSQGQRITKPRPTFKRQRKHPTRFSAKKEVEEEEEEEEEEAKEEEEELDLLSLLNIRGLPTNRRRDVFTKRRRLFRPRQRAS